MGLDHLARIERYLKDRPHERVSATKIHRALKINFDTVKTHLNYLKEEGRVYRATERLSRVKWGWKG